MGEDGSGGQREWERGGRTSAAFLAAGAARSASSPGSSAAPDAPPHICAHPIPHICASETDRSVCI